MAAEGSIWVSHDTDNSIAFALGPNGNTRCRKCGYKCLTRRRHVTHVRRHYIQYYCYCGYHHHQINMVKAHQKKNAAETTHKEHPLIYEVDKCWYKAWAAHAGIKLPNAPKKKKKVEVPKAKSSIDVTNVHPDGADWRHAGRLRSSKKGPKLSPEEQAQTRTRIQKLQRQAALLEAAADRLDEEVARLREELERYNEEHPHGQDDGI